MNLSLDFNRVNYECFCGAWWPASYMFSCKECAKPRCYYCAVEELENQSHCTSCLEETKVGDSRHGYCTNCYLCPICGITLSKRATSEGQFLHCNSCMWTTNDIGLKPKNAENQWDTPANLLEKKFDEIATTLKNLEIASGKHHLEIPISSRKTLSNLGTPANNKYGLARSMQARSREIFKSNESNLTKPSPNVPSLDPSIFTDEIDPSKILTLNQELALVGQYGKMYPIRKPLVMRRQIRCPDHEVLLYRSEYSPLSTTPKNYYPLSQCCPEVKFSHEAEFTCPDEFSVFLSISNWTSSTLHLTIVPIRGENIDCLECQNNEPIEIQLSKKDGTATDEELISGQINLTHDPNKIGSIVFNQRHRIGIHLKCTADKKCSPQNAHLILKICFYRDEKPDTVYEQRVKVFIEQQS